MTDVSTIHVGLLTLAKGYNECARSLTEAMARKELDEQHERPIDYLIAHGLELHLKAALSFSGLDSDQLSKFGHDLLRLYDEAKRTSETASIILRVENDVRQKWRQFFRDRRDADKASLLAFGLGESDCDENYGIHSNDTIGRELPCLRQQIGWLNDRHWPNGGHFRYYSGARADHREKFDPYGSNVDIVRQSVVWGNERLYICLKDTFSSRLSDSQD